MANCIHLSEQQCIERVPKEMFKKKQNMEVNNLFLEPNGNRDMKKDSFKTFCYECDCCIKSLLCLSCGYIYCGRYDSGHALEHYENEGNHCVVMDCITFELYCYTCDDEITLDFEPSLYKVIKSLKLLFDREDEIIDDSEETCDVLCNNLESIKIHSPSDKNSGRNKSKKKGKKSKVSPIFDAPFQGNVINCDQNNSNPLNENRNETIIRCRGLRNIGNTCFMNSAIQALGCLTLFKEYLVALKPLEEFFNEKRVLDGNKLYYCMTDEMKKLIIELSVKSFRDAVTPSQFRESFISFCPRFRGFQQHDSHEFLRYLLDQIHTETKKCDKKLPLVEEGSSIISHFFGGILQSRVICLKCRNRSNKDDEFMDLSLDVPRGKGRIDIMDCLSTFFELEVLEKGEKYDCSKCKMKQSCTKQMFIKKLPEILCLHIKRFRDNGGKIDTLIDYPLFDLSLDGFLTEDSEDVSRLYDLSSIILHIGYGSGSGHYIAFGKRGNSWFQFDDSVVKQCQSSLVTKQKAYVLLYTKRSL